VTFVPGHDVDLVDLDVTLQFYHRRFGDQAAAQLLRHGLHIRGVRCQLRAICRLKRFRPMK